LAELGERVERAKIDSLPAWNAALDLANLIDVGTMLVRSALIRTESRGAHFREDFPSSDPKWLKNIILTRDCEARCEQVCFTRMKPS
jgi:succinate dehydrogenase/fumarate reductase flavoprotein subunit